MKRLLRCISYSISLFFMFLLTYLGAAWALSHISLREEAGAGHDITIYLRGDLVHTDLVLPVRTAHKDWSRTILYTDTRGADSTREFVAIGWGDKGFYLHTPTWSDLKASTAFNAAFGLSTCAMHTTFCHLPKEGEHCVRLVLSAEQYRRLAAYIEHSLQTDAADNPLPVGAEARYNNHDAFYEARGHYNLFPTCNTWTNEALKAAGQKACWWTPFGTPILRRYL